MKSNDTEFKVILDATKELLGGKVSKEETAMLRLVVENCKKKGYSAALTRVVAPFHAKVAIESYRKIPKN